MIEALLMVPVPAHPSNREEHNTELDITFGEVFDGLIETVSQDSTEGVEQIESSERLWLHIFAQLATLAEKEWTPEMASELEKLVTQIAGALIGAGPYPGLLTLEQSELKSAIKVDFADNGQSEKPVVLQKLFESMEILKSLKSIPPEAIKIIFNKLKNINSFEKSASELHSSTENLPEQSSQVGKINVLRQNSGDLNLAYNRMEATGAKQQFVLIPVLAGKENQVFSSELDPEKVSGEIRLDVVTKGTDLFQEMKTPVQGWGQGREFDWQFKEQLLQQVKFMIKEGKSEITFQLKPEELGKLFLKVNLEKGLVMAKFTAASYQVKNLIEASLPALRQQLDDLGLKESRFEVGVGAHLAEQGYKDGPKDRMIYFKEKHRINKSEYENDQLLEPNSLLRQYSTFEYLA